MTDETIVPDVSNINTEAIDETNQTPAISTDVVTPEVGQTETVETRPRANGGTDTVYL